MPEISRNPQDYRPDPGGHFHRRKREREIPGAVIRRCIESGRATRGDNGYVELYAEYLQQPWVLVVDPRRNYVVTGYREGNEPTTIEVNYE